jgi:hypothetical protein
VPPLDRLALAARDQVLPGVRAQRLEQVEAGLAGRIMAHLDQGLVDQ